MMRKKATAWEEREIAHETEANQRSTVKKHISNTTPNNPTPPLRKNDGTYATSPLDKLELLRPVLLLTIATNAPPSPALAQLAKRSTRRDPRRKTRQKHTHTD
jgi:hypothetical protein